MQGILQSTLLLAGLSASTTTRRTHLPVAWESCLIDQVVVNSTSITPYLPLLALLSSSFLPLHYFSFSVPKRLSPNYLLFFFLGLTDLHTNFGTSSAVVITEVEPHHCKTFRTSKVADIIVALDCTGMFACGVVAFPPSGSLGKASAPSGVAPIYRQDLFASQS